VPSPSGLDGAKTPIPLYVRELLFPDAKLPEFMVELIRLGYNTAANHVVMRHWCFESPEMSRYFLKVVW
jgi:hypothetical protein